MHDQIVRYLTNHDLKQHATEVNELVLQGWVIKGCFFDTANNRYVTVLQENSNG